MDDPQLYRELVESGMDTLSQGNFESSWWALDSALHLFPEKAPALWGRGLAAFYSGRFAEGARQFEADMSENGSDVEEVVWHFLCRCRMEGVDKARAEGLLPLAGVPTVAPMMEVLRLFRGDGMVEEVFSASRCPDGSPAQSYNGTSALAYAHFYVGLYYEMEGSVGMAMDHLRAAAEMRNPDFMGKMMNVHFELFRQKILSQTCVPAFRLGPDGANGRVASSIIYGGWQLSSGHLTAGDSRRRTDLVAQLLRAFDAGITAFDCGDIYTGVEELLGCLVRAHALRRGGPAGDVTVLTKLVPDLDAIRAGRVNERYVRAVVRRSLNRLGVARLPLVQLHWWDFSAPGYVEAARALCALSEEGVVGQIGVTNFDVRRTAELLEAGVPLASTQVGG